MKKELNLTEDTFDSEVLKSDIPVLVDFWATWCGPCKMFAPTIDSISDEYSDKIKIGKCNVDDNPNIAAKYGIMSIPTILIFKDGKAVNQSIGITPKDTVINLFKKYI
jgi:thioredoxin 1